MKIRSTKKMWRFPRACEKCGAEIVGHVYGTERQGRFADALLAKCVCEPCSKIMAEERLSQANSDAKKEEGDDAAAGPTAEGAGPVPPSDASDPQQAPEASP